MIVKNPETLHKQHEDFTRKAYETPGFLPARYVFVLTTRCNLRCPFCFQAKKKGADAMDTENWLDLIAQLPDYARVTITGGEPFLHKGFRQIFEKVVATHNCNIITNGTLLSEELIDFLLSYEYFKVLSISIDNVGNTLRKVPQAKWRHTEAMLAYFRKQRDRLASGCVLDAKTTVLDSNASELFETHIYCAETLGCDTHSFQFLKGSELQHADQPYSMDSIHHQTEAETYGNFSLIKEQLREVQAYNVKTGKRAFLHPNAGNLNKSEPLSDLDWLERSNFVPDDFAPCQYPWSSVHINSDGHLFPCLAVPMGNVRHTPLRDIIWGQSFTKFKDTIREQGSVLACNRCGWLKRRR